eukprot:TRINITY_DN27520_c0_g1_i1.p1 TRINITY_DN27520_c0_g1~~TRINITY_DN27520_c0_g1_i1.p1  ORF type:complete len:555 (+),score=124.68 TRINITY_DN27520_c0_g1_i1:107-1771(+)
MAMASAGMGQHNGVPEKEEVSPGFWSDVHAMEHQENDDMEADDQDALEKIELERKFSDNCFGHIAKHKYFEATTITLILLNACEIGWDADYGARYETPQNLYDGPWYFIVAENVFAVYFFCEILIRFIAYRRKLDCFRDTWFLFDSVLVTMMVWETWIMPFLGNLEGLGQLSVLRLLRLLRITRMAKLMRAFPELLMIIKGLFAAVRAVAWTAILLVLITFTTSIVFTSQYHQGHITDDEIAEMDDEDPKKVIWTSFGDMGKSMLTLLVQGTILDDVTAASDAIRMQDNYEWMEAVFILYILLNSFMMLNMLVGILVEVVGSTKEAESERIARANARDAIMTIFKQMDSDGSGKITQEEFKGMKKDEDIMEAFSELGIKAKQFDMYGHLLFGNKDKDGGTPEMGFKALLDAICRLKPGSAVNLLDWSSFKTAVMKSEDMLEEKLTRLENLVAQGSIHSATESTGAVAGASPNMARLVSRASKKPKFKMNFEMMSMLEATPSSDIIMELARRGSIPNIDEIPVSMMDQELYEHIFGDSNGKEDEQPFAGVVPQET